MDELNTLSERLKHARTTKGLSQAELGKAVGVSQSAIAAIESERNKGSTHIATLAAILEVNPMWLETGKGEKETALYQANGAQFGDNATIGCSNNSSVNQFSSSLKNENHPDYTMPDDSMSPVLPKGCGLWINRQDKERINGKIYRIDWQGAELVRQLFFDDPAQIRLHAHNSQYPDKYVPKDQIRIIGRVVSWQVDDL